MRIKLVGWNDLLPGGLPDILGGYKHPHNLPPVSYPGVPGLGLDRDLRTDNISHNPPGEEGGLSPDRGGGKAVLKGEREGGDLDSLSGYSKSPPFALDLCCLFHR